MTIAEQVALLTSELPPERQREILDFAEFLRSREGLVSTELKPRRAGIFEGMSYFMAEDFDEPLPDAFWLGEHK